RAVRSGEALRTVALPDREERSAQSTGRRNEMAAGGAAADGCHDGGATRRVGRAIRDPASNFDRTRETARPAANGVPARGRGGFRGGGSSSDHGPYRGYGAVTRAPRAQGPEGRAQGDAGG